MLSAAYEGYPGERQIELLADADDWPGLIRHWLAHQQNGKPALHHAINLLSRKEGMRPVLSPLRRALAALLQGESFANTDILALKDGPWTEPEWHAIVLVSNYPGLLFAAQADEDFRTLSPVHRQAAENAVSQTEVVALAADDHALRGFAEMLRGSLARKRGDLVAERRHLESAVLLYRNLAKEDRILYLPELAGSLTNLGIAYRTLGDSHAATAANTEVLRVYELLERERPSEYAPYVARSWVNLGNAHFGAGRFGLACECFEEAVRRRRLTSDAAEEGRHLLAKTLLSLASAEAALDESTAAEAHLAEARVLLTGDGGQLAALIEQVCEQVRDAAQMELAQATAFTAFAEAHDGLVNFTDWAALLRHWFLHHEDAILRQARQLAIGRVAEIRRDTVRSYLRRLPAEWWTEDLAPPLGPEFGWTSAEQTTLEILGKAHRLRVIDEAESHHPREDWRSSLEAATAEAEECARLAGTIHDLAMGAFFLRLGADGRRKLAASADDKEIRGAEFERAKAHYAFALAIFRELARDWPDLYLDQVGRTLQNFGAAFMDADRPGTALRFWEEAGDLFRDLCIGDPRRYRSGLAELLNNVAAARWYQGAFTPANEAFQEALDLFTNLAREGDEPAKKGIRDVISQRKALQEERALFLASIPDLTRLTAERDWQGLGRYWLATADQEALENLLATVRERIQENEDRWEKLAQLIAKLPKQGFIPDSFPTELNKEEWDDREWRLIGLLWHRPIMFASVLDVCGEDEAHTPEEQDSNIHLGLLVATGAYWLATEVNDPRLRLSAASLIGAGQFRRGMFEESWEATFLAASIANELSLADPVRFRPLHAEALNSLGLVEQQLGRLRKALQYYKSSFAELSAVSREGDPGALLHNNMALVQCELWQLDDALVSARDSVELCRRLFAAQPVPYDAELANALNTLGRVLQLRHEDEEAKGHLDEAARMYTGLAARYPEAYRADLAMVLVNLGHTVDSLGNPERAVAHLAQAAEIYAQLAEGRPSAFQFAHANALEALALSQGKLDHFPDAASNLKAAIELRLRLADQSQTVHEVYLARTLFNGSTLFRGRGDYQQAVKFLQGALELIDRVPHDRQREALVSQTLTRVGLGDAYVGLEDFHSAEEHLSKALDTFNQIALTTPQTHLYERCYCLALLARTRRAAGEQGLEEAHLLFRQAVGLAESYRGRFLAARHRQHSQNKVLLAYRGLIEVCLERGGKAAWCEALETAEASRARSLMELLADETIAPPGSPREFIERLRQLRRDLRQARRRLEEEELSAPLLSTASSPLATDPATRAADRRGPLVLQLQDATRRHDEAVSQARRDFDRNFDPDRPVAPTTLAELQRLIPDDIPTAFVELVITKRYGSALVLTRCRIEAIDLPDLSREAAEQAMERWRSAYATARVSDGLDMTSWAETAEGLLQEIGRRAIDQISQGLRERGVRRLVLAVPTLLHAFPLHACPLEEGGRLFDSFEVAYAPSLSILKLCAERQRPRGNRLLTLANPTGDRPFARVEAARLRRYHAEADRESASGGRGAREKLLARLPDCQIFHFAGHSWFEQRDALESALVLGVEEEPSTRLRLRDLFCGANLGGNALTILSGCESGMLPPDSADEYVGLPAGFLYAGAACVVSSLWQVDDLSTSLTMDRFYQNWRAGWTVAAALAEAQGWLRSIKSGEFLRDQILTGDFLESLGDEELSAWCQLEGRRKAKSHPNSPPFSSLVYWAPFVAIGLAFPRPGDPQHNA